MAVRYGDRRRRRLRPLAQEAESAARCLTCFFDQNKTPGNFPGFFRWRSLAKVSQQVAWVLERERRKYNCTVPHQAYPRQRRSESASQYCRQDDPPNKIGDAGPGFARGQSLHYRSFTIRFGATFRCTLDHLPNRCCDVAHKKSHFGISTACKS